MDAVAELAELREAVAASQRARASAEHGLAQAEVRAETASRELLDEFGAGTPEEAEALAEALEAELAAETEQVRALLARAGGQE